MLATLWLGVGAHAAIEVDDAKLTAFVTAARAVHEVIRSSTPRIEQVRTEAEADQLSQQIDREVEAAITAAGQLTVEEYREINRLAQIDHALGDRIIKAFQAQASR